MKKLLVVTLLVFISACVPTVTPTPTVTPGKTSTPTGTFTPTRTFTPSRTDTRIPSSTFTPSKTPIPTGTDTPSPSQTPGGPTLKYYIANYVRNNADFATLAGWGIDTAIIDFDINANAATWRARFTEAAKYHVNIVVWPVDYVNPRPNCGWDSPYPVSANGDISKVKPVMDVASEYANFTGMVNAHESFWTCSMTFDEMAGLKTQLKAYALAKGRSIKIWNYINGIYDESMFPASQIARVMDVAVIWKHCAGNAEGTCDSGSNSALAWINSARTRLTSLGLGGTVELVFLMDTFTCASCSSGSFDYTTKFTLAQLETYSCEFLNTAALDGFAFYTWDAGWYDGDLHVWPDLQPAVPYIHQNCTG